MANEKISEMAEVSTNELTDIIPLVRSSNKRTTLQKIRDLFANYFAVAATVTTSLAIKADLVDGKVPAAQIPETHYKGTYISLVALQTAYPTASLGDEAVVDAGSGADAQKYIWDAQEGWVAVSGGGGVTSFNLRSGPVTSQGGDYTTDQVTEANDKLYTSAAEKANAIVITSTEEGEVTPDTVIYFEHAGKAYALPAQNLGDV